MTGPTQTPLTAEELDAAFDQMAHWFPTESIAADLIERVRGTVAARAQGEAGLDADLRRYVAATRWQNLREDAEGFNVLGWQVSADELIKWLDRRSGPRP